MIVHPHPDLVNAYDPQATGEWPNAKFQPTHWMPLPDPPGSTSTQGDR